MQFIATCVIVDPFVKRHLPHDLSDSFRVENDILLGEGVFVDGVTGGTEDDQSFGAEPFGRLQRFSHESSGEVLAFFHSLFVPGFDGRAVQIVATAILVG